MITRPVDFELLNTGEKSILILRLEFHLIIFNIFIF